MTAAAPAAEGDLLLRLTADEPVAWWPVGRRWLPPPRPSAGEDPTAAATVRACARCGKWHFELVATRPLDRGAEVRVDGLTGVRLPSGGDPPWEVTFDGSFKAPRAGVDKVASAAAVLWGARRPDGTRLPVRAVAARTPYVTTPPWAEAAGMRLALGLLADTPAAGAANVVGDNAATVRYGNGTALTRTPRLARETANALGGALARGWRLNWVVANRRLNGAADALAAMARSEGASVERRDDHGAEVVFDSRDARAIAAMIDEWRR